MDQNCLFWGSRVKVPAKLRADILELLGGRPPWWPKIDAAIEKIAKTCDTCQINQRKPSKSVPHSWKHPTVPWDWIRVELTFVRSRAIGGCL